MELGLGLNKYTSTQSGQSFLLNTYSGAIAAWSLGRYLSNSYSSNIVEIERGGDNVSQTFTPDTYTDAIAGAFCSAGGGDGNGRYKTIYDQSGNGLNLTQSTYANMPQAINSGSIILKNGKPAAYFDGSNSFMTVWNNTAAPVVFQDFASLISLFIVHSPDVVTGSIVAWRSANTLIEIRQNTNIGGSANVPINFGTSNTKISFLVTDDHSNTAEGVFGDDVLTTGNVYQSSILVSGDDISLFLNGDTDGSSTLSSATGNRAAGASASTFSIGARSKDDGTINSDFYTGHVQDFIIYKSDQSANRSSIESALNS